VSNDLQDDEVHCWLMDPAAMQDLTIRERATDVLTDDEVARARRFVVAADRESFVAAHALLRVRLAACTGVSPRDIRIDVDDFGKPHLVGRVNGMALNFNISRRREIVACALTWERRLGVDVEILRGAPLEIADHYFAAPEAAALAAAPAEEKQDVFFRVWTMKEAFMKAVGRGFSMPLDSFAVTLSPPSLLRFAAVREPDEWHLSSSAPTPRSRLSVCVARLGAIPPRVRVIWASSLDRSDENASSV
jgi:4'-phosphopantetheinyl transferase